MVIYAAQRELLHFPLSWDGLLAVGEHVHVMFRIGVQWNTVFRKVARGRGYYQSSRPALMGS